jgi:cytochrome b
VTSTDQSSRLQIWDLPVRLFHWLLVPLMAFAWWSAEEGRLDWHRLSGYALLALVLFRIIWGFLGSETARFSHFLRGPAALASYLRALVGGGTRQPILGHNPLGGWSVLAMLALIATLTILGLFAVDVDGIESGPLAVYVSFDTGRWASVAHEFVFNVLLGLILLHLAAVAFYAVFKRDNLVGPMITGAKTVRGQQSHPPAMAPLSRAFVSFAAAAGITYAASQAFWIR